MFCYTTTISQKKLYSSKKPAPPLINLIADTATIVIQPTDLNKILNKIIPIRFAIKGATKIATSVKLNVLNFPDDDIKVVAFNDGEIPIVKSQFVEPIILDETPSWIAESKLNIEIKAGTTIKNKTIFIIKNGDVSKAITLFIHLNESATLNEINVTGKNTVNESRTPNHIINTGNIDTDKAVENMNVSNFDTSKKHIISSTSEKKNTIKIVDSQETILQALYTLNAKNKDETRDTIQIHVKTEGCDTFSNSHTDTLTFKFENLSFPDNSCEIIDSVKVIKASDWKNCEATVVLTVKKNNIDTLLSDQMASISLKDGEGKHIIRLTGSVTFTKPFWLEIGTNFDLLDKIEFKNVYGGVFMFVKDVARISKHTALSFTGGIYESRSSSTSTLSDSGITYRDNTSFILDSVNHYNYFRDTGTFKTVSAVKNIGLFFSPHLRLTRKLTEENGFHFFVSVYTEMLWQNVSVTYDYSELHHAQNKYFTKDGIDSLYKIRFKEKESTYDFRSHYLGIGIPMYIKENNFNFYLNTVFGFSTQKFILIRSLDTSNATLKFPFVQTKQQLYASQSSFAQPKHNFSPFYLFQFRLNEENFGASITGEIRGFLMQNTKPVISMSVSKKFNLTELLKNIVAPFGLAK